MSPELIAILGVGVALAGLLWQGLRRLGAHIDRVEDALNARIDRVEDSLSARMDRLEARMESIAEELREIRDRLSRLEGKVDFLEGYIVRRNEAGAPAE